MVLLTLFSPFILWFGSNAPNSDLGKARDAQDRAALEHISAQLSTAAQGQPKDPRAQYDAAVADSYLAEVATEQKDMEKARVAAEAGIHLAEQAVALKPDSAEYLRILGTLCGQIIPANKLLALKYGHCAQDSLNKAVQLDPRSSMNYVSRGVGNYYLPAALGGGLELASKDFQKAIELDPQSSEAHLWLGLAFRKESRNADARKEFEKAIQLDPARIWAKQQLEKTPEK